MEESITEKGRVDGPAAQNTGRMDERELHMLSVNALAYLGDAVFELLVREHLIRTRGGLAVGELNRLTDSYVRATAQSQAVEKLIPFLTEEEEGVFKRGRNASGASVPKSASVAQYRRATGLEALCGYLYLKNEKARLDELFRISYGEGP